VSWCSAGVPPVPQAGEPGRNADDHPVVPVQRDLLHVRPGPDLHFYHLPSNKIPVCGLAFSIGNLCGPLVLGPLFDSWGRKQIIAGPYAGIYIVSAVLLAPPAVVFDVGVLNAATQTIAWVIIFFFASAGASPRMSHQDRRQQSWAGWRNTPWAA